MKKGSAFLGRLLLATVLSLVLVATAATGGLARTAAHPAAPRIDRLGRVPFVSIHDRVLRDGRTLAGARVAAAHGGVYTAASGEQVKVYVSDSYPVDDTLNQHWADFMARLVHGTELAKLTVYVAPMPELQTLCRSTEADGCYLFNQQEMVVPGETPSDGAPIEEIVAHEYGHHIALNRSNSPWQAVLWGTKRWASYVRVCTRVAGHTAFPGDEGANYFRNPGEAFAESYRVLNDRRAPLSSLTLPWRMIGFDPDPAALALVEQDVIHPWTGSTITHWRARVYTPGVRRFTLATPLDGYARFVLHGPRGSAIAVLDPRTGKPLGAARVEIRYGVCGERNLTLAVAMPRAGTFSVTLASP
jgi:hypothetical protein